MPVELNRARQEIGRIAGYPEREVLAARLEDLLGEPVMIVCRQRNVYASTFPSEVVTCRLADGSERRLFCKYTAGRSHQDHGHRGDVAYEARVYREVLRGLSLPLPIYHGALDSETEGTWLVLEFLEDALRVSKVPQPGMSLAAAWAGTFHTLNEARTRWKELLFLKTYNAAYYAGWSRRTLAKAQAVRPLPRWLPNVCRRYEERIPLLCEGCQTVVHGEFTPHNVLWQNGRVVPIDWESAAVGAGEIDLAVLLEGWDESACRVCEDSYRTARWSGEVDVSFEERLGVARLYMVFRWLADCSDWTVARRPPTYLEELRRLGQNLGLI